MAKYRLEIFRNPDGTPAKDANGKMKFVTQKQGKETKYIASDGSNQAYVDKKWILQNAKNIENLGVSNDQIYPVLTDNEKKRAAAKSSIKLGKAAAPQNTKKAKDVSYFVETETVNGVTRLAQFQWVDPDDPNIAYVVHGVEKSHGKPTIKVYYQTKEGVVDNINLCANAVVDSNGNIKYQEPTQPEIKEKYKKLKDIYAQALANVDYSTLDLSTLTKSSTKLSVLRKNSTGEKFYSALADVKNSIKEIEFIIPVKKAAPYLPEIKKNIEEDRARKNAAYKRVVEKTMGGNMYNAQAPQNESRNPITRLMQRFDDFLTDLYEPRTVQTKQNNTKSQSKSIKDKVYPIRINPQTGKKERVLDVDAMNSEIAKRTQISKSIISKVTDAEVKIANKKGSVTDTEVASKTNIDLNTVVIIMNVEGDILAKCGLIQ